MPDGKGLASYSRVLTLDPFPVGWRSSLGTHYENKPIQNILKILPPKNESFQVKNSKIFHISAQNIDCGYSLEPPGRGGSNKYPQSMF